MTDLRTAAQDTLAWLRLVRDLGLEETAISRHIDSLERALAGPPTGIVQAAQRVTAADFPAALQPIIAQGYLAREFEHALTGRIGFRALATREQIEGNVGLIRHLERRGEHFAVTLNHYAATTNLNMVMSRVGIASQFLLNASINGEQAAKALDELARKTLLDAYARPETTIRQNDRQSIADPLSTDTLTMGLLLLAVARLRVQNAKPIDGVFNCYLDPLSARQLFSDADFRRLFAGATSANQVFREGMVNEFLGLRFIPCQDILLAPHPKLPGSMVRRVVVAGAGALVEADWTGMLEDDFRPADALCIPIDDVVMVTKAPVDRLQTIIAQSWYWVGGFAAPWLPGPDGGRTCRHAVVVEHVG